MQPILSFVNYIGMPHGYVGLPNGDPRILSGFGSAIYELGIFSAPIFLALGYIFLNGKGVEPKEKWLHITFICIAWFNANQLGMPIFILYLAMLLTPFRERMCKDTVNNTMRFKAL